MRKSSNSVFLGSGLGPASRPGMTMLSIALLTLLSACHGGTLDSLYPGELGHAPPPAVNLPPQDAGLEHL
jgi:hypothetical protein